MIALAAAHRRGANPSSGLTAQHGQHGVPFRRAGGWCEQQIHTQPMPILHEHMARKGEPRLFAGTLAGQKGFRIDCALKGHIGASPVAMEVHGRIARIVRRCRRRGRLFRRHARQQSIMPTPQSQGAIHREMLIG